jgi:AcrR family transcriptional regulator
MKGPAGGPGAPPTSAEDDSLRQRVLGAAFAALLDKGYARMSMLDVASRARISKRDLYAMCSGKPAILRELVSERARRMRLPLELPAVRDRRQLAGTLTAFGVAVIQGISSRPVLVLQRLAVALAEDEPEVAQTFDSAGRKVNRAALRRLLAQAQAGKVLGPGDPASMTEDFFALLWGDLQVELLMGVATPPSAPMLRRRARQATDKFLKLYS